MLKFAAFYLNANRVFACATPSMESTTPHDEIRLS
jgi:hypothetical protein